MAEESDLERTESPSERRLEKAREDGQVVRSRELSTCLLLLSAGAVASWGGATLCARLAEGMRAGLLLGRREAFDPQLMAVRLAEQVGEAGMALLPLLAALFVVALMAPMLLGGWLFSSKAFVPDFSRLSPMKGFKRMFSTDGLGEMVKAIAKALLVGAGAAWLLWHAREQLLGLVSLDLPQGAGVLGGLLSTVFLALCGALVLIAAIDVPYQLWRHHSRLKMTKQELRDEARESDGDPAVKARIRSLQREAARRRMMAAVPKADVIVTNPTHYAVALSYQTSMRAPRVVAKGAGGIALKIKEIGAEHKVPMLEAPPLARALYRHTEIDAEIPSALYETVALVMAYVYQLKRWREEGGMPPQAPSGLTVPAGMDPGA